MASQPAPHDGSARFAVGNSRMPRPASFSPLLKYRKPARAAPTGTSFVTLQPGPWNQNPLPELPRSLVNSRARNPSGEPTERTARQPLNDPISSPASVVKSEPSQLYETSRVKLT